MSFRRDFLPLFRIRAIDAGSGAALGNTRLHPTARCRRLLANHQLLSRATEQGLEVYYTLNPWADQPLLAPITAPVRFDFSLALQPGFFAQFQPDFGVARQLHLGNLAADGSIRPGALVSLSSAATVSAADTIRIVPEQFELELTIPPGASRMQVRARHGDAVLRSIKVEELGSGPRIGFDLRGLGDGRFRLTPDNAPLQHTHVLLDNEVAASRSQGLVSITLDSAQQLAPAAGYQFEARFEAR